MDKMTDHKFFAGVIRGIKPQSFCPKSFLGFRHIGFFISLEKGVYLYTGRPKLGLSTFLQQKSISWSF